MCLSPEVFTRKDAAHSNMIVTSGSRKSPALLLIRLGLTLGPGIWMHDALFSGQLHFRFKGLEIATENRPGLVKHRMR